MGSQGVGTWLRNPSLYIGFLGRDSALLWIQNNGFLNLVPALALPILPTAGVKEP